MLTLAVIKENPEAVIERLKVKNFDARTQIERIIELDKVRRNRQQARDNQAAELNKMAAAIGALMKQGKKDEAEGAFHSIFESGFEKKVLLHIGTSLFSFDGENIKIDETQCNGCGLCFNVCPFGAMEKED